jgi:hypothetical protein
VNSQVRGTSHALHLSTGKYVDQFCQGQTHIYINIGSLGSSCNVQTTLRIHHCIGPEISKLLDEEDLVRCPRLDDGRFLCAQLVNTLSCIRYQQALSSTRISIQIMGYLRDGMSPPLHELAAGIEATAAGPLYLAVVVGVDFPGNA